MTIKVILIAATLLIAVHALRGGPTGRRLALRRVLGGLVALAGVVAVLWPDAITWLANLVGVGRGTDLVLYLLVVVFGFVSASLYARVRDLDRQVTVLVRELAVDRRPVADGGSVG